MTDVDVYSRTEAVNRYPGCYSAVVSINDTRDKAPEKIQHGKLPALILNFDDAEQADQARHGYHLATDDDVGSIISFAREQSGPFLVHCVAGVSRSSAAACIIHAAVEDISDEDIVEAALDKNFHWPNLYMIKVADKILGRDLATPIKAWRSARVGGRRIFGQDDD